MARKSPKKVEEEEEGVVKYTTYDEVAEVSDSKFRTEGYVQIAPLPKDYNIAFSRPRVLPGGNHKFQVLKDRSGNLLTGHTKEDLKNLYPELKLINSDGSYNDEFWDKFLINIPNGGKTYDLKQAIDRLQFNILKTGVYPEVAVNINSVEHRPDNRMAFYIIDEVEESETQNSILAMKGTALNHIYNVLTADGVTDMGYLYSMDTRFMKPQTIRAKLAMEAEKDPKEFVHFMNDKERTGELLVIRKAVMFGILQKRNAGIFYDGKIIGKTEDDVRNYMKLPANEQERLNIIQEVEKSQMVSA